MEYRAVSLHDEHLIPFTLHHMLSQDGDRYSPQSKHFSSGPTDKDCNMAGNYIITVHFFTQILAYWLWWLYFQSDVPLQRANIYSSMHGELLLVSTQQCILLEDTQLSGVVYHHLHPQVRVQILLILLALVTGTLVPHRFRASRSTRPVVPFFSQTR